MNQEESDKFPEYVPIAEAAQILGEKEARIFYYADRRQIGIEPGYEQQRIRRYKVADILAIKQRRLEKRRRAAAKKTKPDPVIYDWLKASDMPACLMLDKIVYKEDIDLGEASIYQSWRKKNQHISVAAFDAKDRNVCLGYVGLVPVVSEQICLDVLNGRRIDHSITVEEIDSYDHSGPYTLLAISACTHPDRPDLLYPMLYKHIEFWKSAYPERFIKKIYAQSVSELGDRLAQMLYMAPRYDLNTNAYEIDMQRPQMSRLLKKFKKELADIAPLPPELQWPPVVQSHVQVAETSHQRAGPSVSTRSKSTRPELPDGWVTWRSFADLHDIPQTTVQEDIKQGLQQVETDGWKQGKTPVAQALNQKQQHAFYERYHERARFKICPDCPH